MDRVGLMRPGKWLGKPAGWWCAQKRMLAALAVLLRRNVTKEAPSFLLVVDDDTFVNVDNGK